MPTFASPGPVAARIELSAGAVRVRAEQRADTFVEVRPGNPLSTADVQAAERAVVDFAGDRLLVRVSGQRRLLFFGPGAEVEVEVALPEGSSLAVRTAAGDISCTGRLGVTELESSYGDIRLERAAELRARTASGRIAATAVEGPAEASTSYGDVRIGETGGPARLETSCGDIAVERSLGSLGATTRYGEVRLGEAVRGSVVLETAYGEVDAGIREGTAAWLDVQSASGRVRNLLTATDGPDDATDTVELRARTAYGDITVRRA